MTYPEIIEALRDLGDPQKAAKKAEKFNIPAVNALGVYQSDLKEMAKHLTADETLGLRLIGSEVYEARLLGARVFPVDALTPELMDAWIVTFDNWEICDTFCMQLFARSALAPQKIREWATRDAAFEKRAAFATLAALVMADKQSGNETFLSYFSLIRAAADDNRNFVKKAVSWALRGIGKRNVDLRKEAIALAKTLAKRPEKATRWIASDVLRELEKENVRMSDYPRAIYRK